MGHLQIPDPTLLKLLKRGHGAHACPRDAPRCLYCAVSDKSSECTEKISKGRTVSRGCLNCRQEHHANSPLRAYYPKDRKIQPHQLKYHHQLQHQLQFQPEYHAALAFSPASVPVPASAPAPALAAAQSSPQ